MISRFVRRADVVLATMHVVLWAAVIIVWFFAWRAQPEPMGPPFNFAKRFIRRIDVLVSSPLDTLSVNLATKTPKWFGTDPGLAYTVLFGCMILLAGTLQWFLIGRLVQRVAAKYGETRALVFSTGVACCISLAFVSWAMSW